MYGDFKLPQRLYQSEDEVWNNLSSMSLSTLGICSQAVDLHNKWFCELQKNRNRNIHPLDFPFLRYILQNGDANGQVNLFATEDPTTIQKIYDRYGEKVGDSFYKEITAQEGPYFMNRLCSLNAEWECVKFLSSQKYFDRINEFHPNNGKFDISFTWRNREDQTWYAEAKNILHEDGNLVFIAHVLVGLLWLEEKGKKWRSFKHLQLEGEKIDDTFRKKVIEFLRNNSNKFPNEPNNHRLQKENIDGFLITTSKPGTNIFRVQIQKEICNHQNSSKLEIKFHRGSSSPTFYRISPSSAYLSKELKSPEFLNKFDNKIKELKGKIEKHHVNKKRYLGFINLELHEKYSASQSQRWKIQIKDRLNKEVFPIVLHTSFPCNSNGSAIDKDIYIRNKTADDAGFDS